MITKFLFVVALAAAPASEPGADAGKVPASWAAYVASACASWDQNAIAPTGSSPEALFRVCPAVTV